MLELEYIEKGEAYPDYIIIWLHGLGADGNDFVSIANELNLTDKKIKYIFPHAPIIPVTVNGNMKMRAWYDIYEININRKVDHNGINQSVNQINILISKLKIKHKSVKFILAGFSQGGVISLEYLLRGNQKIHGAVILSSYMSDMTNNNIKYTVDFPIFFAHGIHDQVIPVELALDSKLYLEKLNIHVEWHTYNMAHNVIFDEINDIKSYLMRIINGN